MKIRTTTTTALLISNTAVPNPYSHSKVFHLQSFAPLSYVPGSFNTVDLSQSDIQILYGLRNRRWYSAVCLQHLNWNFQQKVCGPWSTY